MTSRVEAKRIAKERAINNRRMNTITRIAESHYGKRNSPNSSQGRITPEDNLDPSPYLTYVSGSSPKRTHQEELDRINAKHNWRQFSRIAEGGMYAAGGVTGVEQLAEIISRDPAEKEKWSKRKKWGLIATGVAFIADLIADLRQNEFEREDDLDEQERSLLDSIEIPAATERLINDLLKKDLKE